MKTLRTLLLAALLLPAAASAQDPLERLYNYEILRPDHEAKSPVKSFAQERVTERLDRGLTIQGAPADTTGVYLNWRMLASDHPGVGFNVYRKAGAEILLLNRKPVVKTSDYLDATAPAGVELEYWIEPVYNLTALGQTPHIKTSLEALGSAPKFTSFKLAGTQTAGKLGVGDLNGDGRYDFVVRTPDTNTDPGVQGTHFDAVYTISAYLADGTHLWDYNLGEGVEPGIWYSPVAVYDFNGDGKAEVAMKICPDGKRNPRHRVDSGSEYLLVLDGMTGKEIARAAWPERSWRLGDLNRQNRNQIGMAYLDGKTPAIIAARGTYRAMLVDAWELHDGKLTKLWRWDGDEENPVVRSQGAHNMVAGDVDGDGRDELLLGGCMLDDNGTLLWSTGIGHTDKTYMTDIDPSRPGMEVMHCAECWNDQGRGVCVVDAATGKQVWNIGHPTTHVGDGMVADFDPAHPGLECFAKEDKKAGKDGRYLLSAKGKKIDAERVPDCRNWVWWDADLLRETFAGDDNRYGAESSAPNGMSVIKWPGTVLTPGIEGSILLIADLRGDWREEVVTAVGNEIRVYSTNIPAKDRRVTLMQDPVYRSYVLERSQGYHQAPVPSYYLGE